MKNVAFLSLILFAFLFVPLDSEASGRGRSRGGSYKGSSNSRSHKGGKYSNPKTGNHYQKRK